MTWDLKSNPLRVGGCGQNNFTVCTNRGKGDCFECSKVKITAEYEGETAGNPGSRGLEHAKDLENECEKSQLCRHCSIQHGGRRVDFKMDVLIYLKYPTVRQVNEGAKVRLQEADFQE